MKTTQKFIFSEPEKEHVIQLKKKCKWCWLWLLLLLLPLLLLIPLQKEVKFKVVHTFNNEPVANLQVNFEYTQRNFYDFDSSAFLTRHYPFPSPAFLDTTNSQGLVIFKNIKYSVYQFLFRSNDSTRTYASGECFQLDTVINFFDLKTENILYTVPALRDYEFTVVDASDNNEPLPDALVRIKSDQYGISDSARSDAGGKVLFKNFPKCSSFEVVGSKHGWKDDKISGNADDLYHKEDSLFLEQEKVILKFFVQDLYSKKPLVNAHGKLYFKANASKQIGSDAITNINGVAKGVFENVHKIKEFKIDVNQNKELKFYNDSSTMPKLGFVSAEKWILQPDTHKIIFLRPNPNPILFRNIDCNSQKGIPNVKNKIVIHKSKGDNLPAIIVISDKNGYFSVSAGMGDHISIESVSDNACPNEYVSNISTISYVLFDDLLENETKRNIPLCPLKPKKLQFINVDEETGDPLKGVKNRIITQSGKTKATK